MFLCWQLCVQLSKGNVLALPQWCVAPARISWNSVFHLLECWLHPIWVLWRWGQLCPGHWWHSPQPRWKRPNSRPPVSGWTLSLVCGELATYLSAHRLDLKYIYNPPACVRLFTGRKNPLAQWYFLFLFIFLTCSRCTATKWPGPEGKVRKTWCWRLASMCLSLSLSLPLSLLLLFTRPKAVSMETLLKHQSREASHLRCLIC